MGGLGAGSSALPQCFYILPGSLTCDFLYFFKWSGVPGPS